MAAIEEWKDVTEDQDGGILKKILVEGEGDLPKKGDNVKVHYVGTLTDSGEKFDSSRDRGDKFDFDLGAGRVIKGWDVGVATMKVGEKCILRIQSKYGYGENGSPPKIPGGASLDFEVELFDASEKWQSVYEGEGLEFISLVDAQKNSWATPKEEGKITFDLEVFSDSKMKNKVYSEDSISLEVMDFKTYEKYPTFLHQSSQNCKENCKIVVKCERNNTPPKHWNVPENDHDFYFTILMQSIENPKDVWQMNSTEKLEAAQNRKGKGNTLFKEKHYEQALKAYEKALESLKDLKKGDDDIANTEEKKKDENEEKNQADSVEDVEVQKLEITCHSNMAMTNLKLQKWDETISCADKCIELDAKHLKSLARRGQAYMELGNVEAAISDFTLAVEIDPKNSFNKLLLSKCEKKLKKEKKKEKAAARRMFGKGGLYADAEPIKAAAPQGMPPGMGGPPGMGMPPGMQGMPGGMQGMPGMQGNPMAGMAGMNPGMADMMSGMEPGMQAKLAAMMSGMGDKGKKGKKDEFKPFFDKGKKEESDDVLPDLGISKGLKQKTEPEDKKEADVEPEVETAESAI